VTTEGRRPTVIIADDYADMHTLFRRLLEPEFEVVGDAYDGQALLEATARLTPDLIVVDVFMPVLGGIEAVQRLKAQSSSVAVVFITADEGQETMRRALNTGALGFVRKASAAEDLLPAAQAVLRGQQFVSSKPS
jgi:two-component system, NarL family, invasion response regulator UvrY